MQSKTEGREMLKEPTLKQITDYYTEKANFLSLPFEERYGNLRKELGDYITEDIASEWSEDGLVGLYKLFDDQLVNGRCISLYKAIVKNFDEVSSNGSKYETVIWTLEGLETHPFWKEQQRLAKELLRELESIKLDQE